MWIVGAIVLLIIGVTVIVAIGWSPRATPSPPLWDVSALGGTYTGIVGTLAGFSVASATFIAGFRDARTSPMFVTVIGMLLLAFLILVFSALMYASAPNANGTVDDAALRLLSHALASICGCVGLSTSWLALVPLLAMIGLPSLAAVFTWLLLVVTLSATGWVALFDYRLTLAAIPACLAIPVVGFALPAVYRLVAVRVWPSLWPAADAALNFTFVAIAVIGVIFSLHLGLLAAYGHHKQTRFLERNGHRLVLASSAAYASVLLLIWFAVAMP